MVFQKLGWIDLRELLCSNFITIHFHPGCPSFKWYRPVGRGVTQQSFIRGGSAPRSNALNPEKDTPFGGASPYRSYREWISRAPANLSAKVRWPLWSFFSLQTILYVWRPFYNFRLPKGNLSLEHCSRLNVQISLLFFQVILLTDMGITQQNQN